MQDEAFSTTNIHCCAFVFPFMAIQVCFQFEFFAAGLAEEAYSKKEKRYQIQLVTVFSEKIDVPQPLIFSFSTAMTLKIRSRSPNLITSLLRPNYVTMKIW